MATEGRLDRRRILLVDAQQAAHTLNMPPEVAAFEVFGTGRIRVFGDSGIAPIITDCVSMQGK